MRAVDESLSCLLQNETKIRTELTVIQVTKSVNNIKSYLGLQYSWSVHVTRLECRNSTPLAILRANSNMSSNIATVREELSFSHSFSVVLHSSSSSIGPVTVIRHARSSQRDNRLLLVACTQIVCIYVYFLPSLSRNCFRPRKLLTVFRTK